MNGSGEEQFDDVISETVARSGELSIETDFLFGEVDGASMGVRTIAWPDTVCIVAGTESDDNRAVVVQKLSPGQARDIAAGLQEAASQAEGEPGTDEPEPDTDSLLRRFLP